MGRLISVHPWSDHWIINQFYRIFFKKRCQVFYKYWPELGEDIVEVLEPLGVEIVSRGKDEELNRDLLILRKQDYQTFSDHLEGLIDNLRYFHPLDKDFRDLIAKERYPHYVIDEEKLSHLFRRLLGQLAPKYSYRESMRCSEEYSEAKEYFDPSLFTNPTPHTNELLARLDLILTLLVLKPVGLVYSEIYL